MLCLLRTTYHFGHALFFCLLFDREFHASIGKRFFWQGTQHFVATLCAQAPWFGVNPIGVVSSPPPRIVFYICFSAQSYWKSFPGPPLPMCVFFFLVQTLFRGEGCSLEFSVSFYTMKSYFIERASSGSSPPPRYIVGGLFVSDLFWE